MSGIKKIAPKHSLFEVAHYREYKLVPRNSETGLKPQKGSSNLLKYMHLEFWSRRHIFETSTLLLQMQFEIGQQMHKIVIAT